MVFTYRPPNQPPVALKSRAGFLDSPNDPLACARLSSDYSSGGDLVRHWIDTGNYSVSSASFAGTITYIPSFGDACSNTWKRLDSFPPSAQLNTKHVEDMERRVRLVMSLLKHARHDFHRPSETHIYFCFYATHAAVRSFHPYKDRAFAEYVIQANRVAMAEDANIEEWLEFITSPDDALPAAESPCSGVVNFRLSSASQEEMLVHSRDRALSLNRLSISAFKQTTSELRKVLKQQGVEKVGLTVRKFYDALADEQTHQHTVRVGIAAHALIISLAHELGISSSAMASYLIHMYLFGYQYDSSRSQLFGRQPG